MPARPAAGVAAAEAPVAAHRLHHHRRPSIVLIRHRHVRQSTSIVLKCDFQHKKGLFSFIVYFELIKRDREKWREWLGESSSVIVV